VGPGQQWRLTTIGWVAYVASPWAGCAFGTAWGAYELARGGDATSACVAPLVCGVAGGVLAPLVGVAVGVASVPIVAVVSLITGVDDPGGYEPPEDPAMAY
jgi:hypothetical protein